MLWRCLSVVFGFNVLTTEKKIGFKIGSISRFSLISLKMFLPLSIVGCLVCLSVVLVSASCLLSGVGCRVLTAVYMLIVGCHALSVVGGVGSWFLVVVRC
jgi:hypothetical protein